MFLIYLDDSKRDSFDVSYYVAYRELCAFILTIGICIMAFWKGIPSLHGSNLCDKLMGNFEKIAMKNSNDS